MGLGPGASDTTITMLGLGLIVVEECLGDGAELHRHRDLIIGAIMMAILRFGRVVCRGGIRFGAVNLRS